MKAFASFRVSSLPDVTANCAVFLWGFVLFLPCLTHEFVSWDDEANFVETSGYRGFGSSQLWWMATAFHHGHYHPLTWLTIALDYSIWGLDEKGRPDPTGFHLTNVLLHAVNCVLVYTIMRWVLTTWSNREQGASSFVSEGSKRYAAVAAAMLWSGHPLRTESVAWATERRDVLSTALLLGSLLCYLHSHRAQQTERWSVLAWLLFTLSLLSKAGGIVWPVILLMADVTLLRRLEWNWKTCWRDPRVWRILWEKLPYALLAAVFGWIAVRAQQAAGAWTALVDHGWYDRILQAASGLGWYVLKTAWPMGLSPLYPLPPTRLSLLIPEVFVGVLVFILLTVVTLSLRRRRAGLWLAWCFFLVLVAPVSGLAQSGPQWFADRYTYLATIPWFVLAAGLLRTVQQFVHSRRGIWEVPASAILSGLLGCLLLISGWLTIEQVQIWRNSVSLWTHAASVTSYNPTAYNHLASALIEQEQFDEALLLLDQALAQEPGYATAWNNRGNLKLRMNQPEAALSDYSRAVELKPDSEKYWNNHASALGELGRFEEARASLDRAIELAPAFAEAYWNRFLTWVNLREPDHAASDLATYLRLVGTLTSARQEEAQHLLQQAATPAETAP